MGIIVALATGGYFYRNKTNDATIPAATRSSVDFPLLYPTKLPAGFSIKKNSFSTTNNIVLFEADDSAFNRIAFSVQAKPATFDFKTFYKESLGGTSTFNTNLGEAAIGTTSGRLIGSLTTNQSWLIITSLSKQVKSPEIRLILSNTKELPALKQP